MVSCEDPHQNNSSVELVNESFAEKILDGRSNTNSHKVKFERGKQSLTLEFVDEFGKSFEATINISDIVIKFNKADEQLPKDTNSNEKLPEKNTSERSNKTSVSCDTSSSAELNKNEVAALEPAENENDDDTIVKKLANTDKLIKEFFTAENETKNPFEAFYSHKPALVNFTPSDNSVDGIPSWDEFRKNFSMDMKKTLKSTNKRNPKQGKMCNFLAKNCREEISSAQRLNEDKIKEMEMMFRTAFENCQKNLNIVTDLLKQNDKALDEISIGNSKNIKPIANGLDETSGTDEKLSKELDPITSDIKKENNEKQILYSDICQEQLNSTPNTTSSSNEHVKKEEKVLQKKDEKENENLKKKLSDIGELINKFIKTEKELKSHDRVTNQNKIDSIKQEPIMNTDSNNESEKPIVPEDIGKLLKNINETVVKLSEELSVKKFDNIDLSTPVEKPEEQSEQQDEKLDEKPKDENLPVKIKAKSQTANQENSKVVSKLIKEMPTAPLIGRQRETFVWNEVPTETSLFRPKLRPTYNNPSNRVSSSPTTRSNQDFYSSVPSPTPRNLNSFEPRSDPFRHLFTSPVDVKKSYPYEDYQDSYSRRGSCSSSSGVNRTKKFDQFIADPKDNMPVTSLPGIGPVYGGRLENAGFDSVGKVYRQFVKLGRNESAFKSWLNNVASVNSRWSAHCYDALCCM